MKMMNSTYMCSGYRRKVLEEILKIKHARIQTGDRGSGHPPPPPPKHHKYIGFLSDTGQEPLKNHKVAKQAYNVGPSSTLQRSAIHMVFRWNWRFAGGPMMVRLKWYLDLLSPNQLKKRCQRVGPPEK